MLGIIEDPYPKCTEFRNIPISHVTAERVKSIIKPRERILQIIPMFVWTRELQFPKDMFSRHTAWLCSSSMNFQSPVRERALRCSNATCRLLWSGTGSWLIQPHTPSVAESRTSRLCLYRHYASLFTYPHYALYVSLNKHQ